MKHEKVPDTVLRAGDMRQPGLWPQGVYVLVEDVNGIHATAGCGNNLQRNELNTMRGTKQRGPLGGGDIRAKT